MLPLHKSNLSSMDIQSEKLAFIQWFSGLNDLSTIKEFLALKKEKEIDFWDELSPEDQAAINEGLNQLDSGQHVSHESVREEIKKRFNF